MADVPLCAMQAFWSCAADTADVFGYDDQSPIAWVAVLLGDHGVVSKLDDHLIKFSVNHADRCDVIG